MQTECSVSASILIASNGRQRGDGKLNKIANECWQFRVDSSFQPHWNMICVWNNFVSWAADIKKLGVSLSSPLHNEITRGRSRVYYWQSSWTRIKQSLSLSLSRGRVISERLPLIVSLNERLNCIPSFQSRF